MTNTNASTIISIQILKNGNRINFINPRNMSKVGDKERIAQTDIARSDRSIIVIGKT